MNAEENSMKKPSRFLKSLIAIVASLLLIVSYMPPVLADPGDAISQTGNAPLYNALVALYPTQVGLAHPGYITITELQSLTGTISLTNKGITNLTGLENCTGITELVLSGNTGISSIAPIASLANLQSLYLNQTGISALPASLAGMTNLKYISLVGIPNLNGVSNLHAALLSLPKIKTLDSSNPVTLIISNSNITDVSFLTPAAAPGVTTLDWQGIPSLTAANIATLSGLTQLKSLDLANDAGITNASLATIGAMTNLIAVGIPSCNLTSIGALSTLLNLTTLTIGCNQITDISPLSGLTKLACIRMGNNYISDLSPLAGKADLNYLDASANYLDPTPGSADRAILDTIAGIGTVDYSNQLKTTITYACDAAMGTPAKTTDANVYYGQSVTLPGVTANAGFTFAGWDTDGNGTTDHAGGASISFLWPTLPILNSAVTFTAHFSGFKVILLASNAPLYNALHSSPYNLDPSNSGSITDNELAALTGELNLSNKGITSIQGLQYCTNITTLTLNGNTGLSTLLPLDGQLMPLLQTLNLVNTGVSGFTEHMNMPALTIIDLTENHAMDNDGLSGITAPTSKLPQLGILLLRRCSELNSIDCLTAMTSLTSLYLDSTPLMDLPASMSGMTKLNTLVLTSVPNLASLPHLHALLTLPKLTTLDISKTNITNVGFLSTAHSLSTLKWQNTSSVTAANIGTISSLTQLTTLYLDGDSNIGNAALATIGAFTNLKQLDLENCGISNIASLAPLTGLNVLNLQHNSIADIDPVAGMTDLQQLYISYNPVSNISSLAGLTKLNTFYATYTSVSDISELSGKPLQDLNLACDYLDPTAGSTDMAIINSLAAAGCNVTYNDQAQITITFSCDPMMMAGPVPADMTVYYGQYLTLPVISVIPNYGMHGWDTNNDNAPDTSEGSSVPFSWPILPIPGNTATFIAWFNPLDAGCELAGLTSSQAMSPAFSPSQFAYSIAVPAATASVTLTPVLPAGATATIDGAAVSSKAIAVSSGATKSAIIVVTETGNGYNSTYIVTLTRAMPDASRLLALGNSTGTLSPAFYAYTTSYTLTLSEGTASVTFTPVKAASSAKLYLNGAQKTSLKITLDPGKSKTLTMKVVSASNAKATYTVTIKRNASTNDNLKTLTASGCTLTPAFSSGVTAYTVKVPEAKGSVKIKVTKADSKATVTINGSKTTSKSISIANGQTKTVTIVVKAQSGATKTYTITMTRPPHIKSFSASPTVSGYPTVQIGVKPITFTYKLASVGGNTKIQISIGGVWTNLMSRYDGTGTKTFVWDGAIAGIPLAAGKYDVRLTAVYGGIYAVFKSKTIAVK